MLQVLSAAVFFIPFALFSKQSFRIRWRDAGNILIVTMLIVYGWMYMLLWGSSYTRTNTSGRGSWASSAP